LSIASSKDWTPLVVSIRKGYQKTRCSTASSRICQASRGRSNLRPGHLTRACVAILHPRPDQSTPWQWSRNGSSAKCWKSWMTGLVKLFKNWEAKAKSEHRLETLTRVYFKERSLGLNNWKKTEDRIYLLASPVILLRCRIVAKCQIQLGLVVKWSHNHLSISHPSRNVPVNPLFRRQWLISQLSRLTCSTYLSTKAWCQCRRSTRPEISCVEVFKAMSLAQTAIAPN